MIKSKIKCFIKKSVNFVKFFGIRKKSSFYYLLSAKPGLKIKINGTDSFFKLTGPISSRKNVSFYISDGGMLEIGKDSFFNENCCVACRRSISIGNGCLFGPNVCVFDHDHLFKDGIIEHNQFVSSDVKIGNNVWIGANAVILRGTSIGDNAIVGAGAIVKGIIPKNSIVIQKKEQLIKEWC